MRANTVNMSKDMKGKKFGFSDFLLSKKRLTLIMSLPANNPELCRAAFEEGADVVKVHINVSHKASGTHFGRLVEEKPSLEKMLELAKGPMGIVLGGSVANASLDAEEIRNLGFSFYSVYAHHVPVWVMPMDKELMAACDESYSMEEISCMKSLGVNVLEASIIPAAEYGSPLNLRDLLHYYSIVRISKLPVVVPTQRKIRTDEVEMLSKTGVKGLMIGAIVTGKTEDSIRRAVGEFREAIERLDK